jgi:hypothetical protein
MGNRAGRFSSRVGIGGGEWKSEQYEDVIIVVLNHSKTPCWSAVTKTHVFNMKQGTDGRKLLFTDLDPNKQNFILTIPPSLSKGFYGCVYPLDAGEFFFDDSYSSFQKEEYDKFL